MFTLPKSKKPLRCGGCQKDFPPGKLMRIDTGRFCPDCDVQALRRATHGQDNDRCPSVRWKGREY